MIYFDERSHPKQIKKLPPLMISQVVALCLEVENILIAGLLLLV